MNEIMKEVLPIIISFLLLDQPMTADQLNTLNHIQGVPMTVSSADRLAGPFIGNDSITSLPFTFRVFEDDDLLVVQEDDSTGVTTTLALTTDYSVSINSNQSNNPGGTIILVSALATGQTVFATTDLDNVQEVVLTNQGGFFPQVISGALDRIVVLIQQISETTSRSLKYPLGDTTSATLPSSTDRAGKLLKFDDNGAPDVGPEVSVLESIGSISGEIVAVANNESNINSAASNESNINAVAAIDDEVLAVANTGLTAASLASVVAVDNNEANINTIAAELPDIQVVAGTLTMTLSELTLTLHETVEVAGSQYLNLYNAIEYAKTVLQVGGTLTVNAPAGSFIGAADRIDLSNGRMNLRVIGTSGTSFPTDRSPNSLLSVGRSGSPLLAAFTADNISIYIENVLINENTSVSSRVFDLENCKLEISGSVASYSNHSHPFLSSKYGTTIISTSSVTQSGLFVGMDTFNIVGGEFYCDSCEPYLETSSANTSADRILFSFEGAEGLIENTDMQIDSTNGATIGVKADNASNVIVNAPTFTNIATQYDPPANTHGNFNSLITTEDNIDWQDATLLNGWTDYSATHVSLRYKRKNNTVYVEGSIAGGASSSIIANLPVGYRKSAGNIITRQASSDSNGSSRVDFQINGNILLVGTAPSTYLSISYSFDI